MGKKHHRHDNPEVKSKQTPRSLGRNKEEFGLEFSDINASKQIELATAQKYAQAEKQKSEGARKNSSQ